MTQKNSSLILQIIFDELSMVNNKRFSRSGQGVPTKCDKVVGVQYCCLVQNRQKNGTSFSLGMYLHEHLVVHTVQLALTL